MNIGVYNNNTVTRETIEYRGDVFGWTKTDEFENDGEWSITYRTGENERGVKIAVDSVDELHGEDCNNIFVTTTLFNIRSIKEYYVICGLVTSQRDATELNDFFISSAPHARTGKSGQTPTDVKTETEEQSPWPDIDVVRKNIDSRGYSGPYAVKWVGRTGDLDVREFSSVLEAVDEMNTEICNLVGREMSGE